MSAGWLAASYVSRTSTPVPSRPLGPTVVPANPLVAHAVSTAMYVEQRQCSRPFTIAATLPVRQLPHDQDRTCVCVGGWVCALSLSPFHLATVLLMLLHLLPDRQQHDCPRRPFAQPRATAAWFRTAFPALRILDASRQLLASRYHDPALRIIQAALRAWKGVQRPTD